MWIPRSALILKHRTLVYYCLETFNSGQQRSLVSASQCYADKCFTVSWDGAGRAPGLGHWLIYVLLTPLRLLMGNCQWDVPESVQRLEASWSSRANTSAVVSDKISLAKFCYFGFHVTWSQKFTEILHKSFFLWH